MHAFIQQPFGGLKHKIQNAYSSNSEDALTWSCFDTLAQVPDEDRVRALTDIWELTFSTRDVPEGILSGVIKIGERYGDGESTEVDASIEGRGALVFIEAKLYSPMSQADAPKGKPHNQIERKLRIGLREATKHDQQFYFILLDVAPMPALRLLNPNVSLKEASESRVTGFAAKWLTAYWFARYKYGSHGSLAPLQKLIRDTGFPNLPARNIATNMGWLTWADVFKVVLRAVVQPQSRRSHSSDLVAAAVAQRRRSRMRRAAE